MTSEIRSSKTNFLFAILVSVFKLFFSRGQPAFECLSAISRSINKLLTPHFWCFLPFLWNLYSSFFLFLMEKYLKILEKFISTNKSCLHVFFTYSLYFLRRDFFKGIYFFLILKKVFNEKAYYNLNIIFFFLINNRVQHILQYFIHFCLFLSNMFTCCWSRSCR